MAWNVVEVMIGVLKLCESLLFSKPLLQKLLFILLEDKQKGKSGGMIHHGFLATFSHGI